MVVFYGRVDGIGEFIIPFAVEIARIIQGNERTCLGVKKLKIKCRKGPYQSPEAKHAAPESVAGQGV